MLNPNATNTCDYFKVHFPSMTIMPTDCNYTTENEVSWNAGNWLGPTCVLTPSSPEDLSCAVKTLVKFATPFAMRGGGHMTITDAANINSTGILISSTNLLTMELSKDKSYLSVAPGRRWGDTYVYLDEDKSGKMVVGGRYSPVGIPGYLLGGGMSFFSYEYGFSSTNGNVKTFECVLADGSIVEATVENEYSDLYWALQGGGNSFCLLTKFELRTIDSPSITLGNLSYGFGDTTKDQWLSSVLNYVLNGSSDPKAAITPVARYAAGMPGPRYDATLFYNGNVTKPAILNDFQGGLLPGNNLTTLIPLTMSAFAKAVAPAFEEGGESQGLRQRFYVVSHKATREAMDVVHETFFDGVIAHNLTGLSGFFVGLAWNSITTEFIAKSNSGIGCPQGIPEEPVFWVEEALTWGDAADDAKIEAFVQVVNANITAQLTAMDASPAYIYLNDADGDQDVFGGYPPENVQCLKSIRDKYDPLKIFTNLMPGGFKVAHA
ncbi:FAD binding domain-containing protein [Amylocarpus encephaloides]|uniref:FAD binding domain-containing protein n=1 Tax=Amylocarpus encephaloides TaxID=45428 RepID=A0A9P8CA61_9HELO|nr:FAD binding domain-containing protein [Amylocarpus encephaloides]